MIVGCKVKVFFLLKESQKVNIRGLFFYIDIFAIEYNG
jgi:hypothetical protein